LYWRKLILDVDPEKAQPLGTQTFSGIELTGYLLEERGIETRVWVDPKSQLPVKINVTQSLSDGTSGFEMQADVSYNQRFDDSLFSLE
jgi:outer membrane lipoprotein-sorting protein